MKIGLLSIVCLFVALSLGSALSESLTYDEVFYLEEGRRIFQTRTFSDPYNPPLPVLLSGLPSVMGLTASTYTRMVSIVLGVFLVLAVYRTGGILAAILVALEPTVLAHSHLVTTDIAATLFIYLAFQAWMRLLKNGRTLDVPLLGMAVGYALASKMTALPYLFVAFAVSWWMRRPRRGASWIIRRWLSILAGVIVVMIVVWASYLFTWDVVIRERDDAGRVSVRLIKYASDHNVPIIEKAVLFLQTQPLPLGTYAATIKNTMLRVEKPAMIFFDGQMYDRAEWYFTIVNFFRKIPIPLFIMIAAGIVLDRKRETRMMAIIGVGIVGVASLMGTVPLVRLVLPAIPFLAIVGATGIRKIGAIRGIGGKIIICALLFWFIIGTLAQYPHFISYANETVGPREERHEKLNDSNLDWGQALPDLVRYAKNNTLGTMKLSYFGRDDGGKYGLPSKISYGSWKFEDICAFHEVAIDPKSNREATVISVSNWYSCGYNKEEAYQKANIQNVVADVFLIF